MFKRGERERTRLKAETDPYRQMAVDLEVEDKLQAQGFELTIANRHLLTSNDRYQVSAAHYQDARNDFILAGTIASAVGEDAKESIKTIPFTTEFVKTTYQKAKDKLETGDQIMAQVGFVATHTDLHSIITAENDFALPPFSEVSHNFIEGLLSGLEIIGGFNLHHYQATLADSSVPNNFKRQLQRLIDPLFAQASAKRKAIDRVGGQGVNVSTRPEVLREIYEDAQALRAIHKRIGTLLSMPRIHDESFELRESYDETQPEKRAFNPSVLGTPAVRETVVPPARPPKPFSIESLGTTTAPPPPKKPFNPDVLGSPTLPEPAKPVSPRPFNPDVLGKTPHIPPKREFDPSILEPKKSTE